MKTLLTILFLFAFWNLKAQETIRITRHLVKHECAICGIDFWLCEEIPEKTIRPVWGMYGNELGGGFFECWREDNQKLGGDAVSFKIDKGYVCADCYGKYIDGWQQILQEQFDNYWNDLLKGFVESRKKYDKQRKDAIIEAKKKQIQDMQEELEIIQGKRKPKVDSGDIPHWRKGFCDTVSSNHYIHIDTVLRGKWMK